MHRRRLLAGMGAGLAVGLAGCGDDEPDDDGSENDGPDGGGANGGGANGDDPEETPFEDAAWRDGDGLDVETLAESHVSTVTEAGGFTLSSSAVSTHDGDSEPSGWLPSQEYEAAFELERERHYLRQEMTEDEDVDRAELYIADGEAFVREQTGDQVRYDRQEAELSTERFREMMEAEAATGVYVPREGADGEVTYAGLVQWNLSAAGEGEVDGQRTAHFTADAFDGNRNVPREIESASASVDVFEAGFVPRSEQTWEGTHEDVAASVTVDIAYHDVGETTVEEPDWVEDARAETDDE